MEWIVLSRGFGVDNAKEKKRKGFFAWANEIPS
jgi:hypothetical protein